MLQDHLTVEKFKDLLPMVPIVIVGKKLWGRCSGRKNRFCTVSLTNENRAHCDIPLFVDYTFSWESVARAYNTGDSLKT